MVSPGAHHPSSATNYQTGQTAKLYYPTAKLAGTHTFTPCGLIQFSLSEVAKTKTVVTIQ